MALTYEPIATTGSLSGQSSFSFSSFSGYTDLVLIFSGTSTTGNSFYIRYNSDSGSNYALAQMQGNGSTPTGARETNSTYINLYAGLGISNSSSYKVQIFNYSGSQDVKHLLSEGSKNNAGTGLTNRLIGAWRSTSAITSISATTFAGTFNAGSFASLYGITRA